MHTNLAIFTNQGTLISTQQDLHPKFQEDVIDPREQMIRVLEQQNQLLLQEIDKLATVFQKNKVEKDQTIISIAKSNEELSAALIAADRRNNEQAILHETALKALQDKYEQRIAILNEEAKKTLELSEKIDSYFKNLPIIQEYQNLNAHASQWGNRSPMQLRSPSFKQLYEQKFGARLRAIQERMGDNYKNRPTESLTDLMQEASTQAALVKSKIHTIKEELEKK